MSVKASAAILASEPGMGWIKQLQTDPALSNKIDWNKIEEAHQHWNYKQQGLTPAAAAVIAIVVAFFTAGAGSSIVGGVTGTAVTTTSSATILTASAVVQAGVTSLASKAAVSLINNGGNLDATLKELGSSDNLKQLATTLVTAGILQGLGNTLSVDGKPLSSITANDGFAANVGRNLITGLTRATLTSAITGTNLETSIRTEVIASVLNAASAQGADWIGTQAQNGSLNAFGHAFAHAVAGCVAGAAGASAPGSGISTGNGCGAGALGAAVGELSAQLYGAADPAKTVAFASMISGIAAALTGQSAQGVAIASGAGANAAQNNYLTHQQAENKKTELSKAKTPQERAAIEAKYQQLDNAQQTAAEQCLLAGQCQSVTDPLMLQGALNDLKNACAVPRYCSPDEVKSITQLNRLLDQDAITPNHLLEELVIGGGVGKIVGAGVSTVAARLFGGAIGKAAETIGVNSADTEEAINAGRTSLGWPETGGAGPVPGTIGITDQTAVGALRNYSPKGGGVEFVYDPATNTFVTGHPSNGLFLGSPHEQLAQSIGAVDRPVVGGTFQRGANGEIFTTENSGHYGPNWTDPIRQQFQNWLNNRVGVLVNHQPWGK